MKKIDLNTTDLSNTQESSLGKFEDRDDFFNSPFFSDKKELLRNLLSAESPETTTVFEPRLEDFAEAKNNERLIASGSIAIHGWKNVENISARLVDTYDDVVILECLIDKEMGVYEEREFKKSLFEGYELVQGSIFCLRFFERPHETRMEIHSDPGLKFSDDFPSIDFKATFEKSKLFKKS